jgi:hypothetical protein
METVRASSSHHGHSQIAHVGGRLPTKRCQSALGCDDFAIAAMAS